MNSRRIACALIGLWLGAMIAVALIAASNFRIVNQMLTNPQPELAAYLKIIGPDRMRMLFRHEAGEVNRALFEAWGLVQILITLLLFGLLLFGTKVGRVVLGMSLFTIILSTVMHLAITPSIVGYGRSLDFVGPDREPALRQRVQAFHSAYSTMAGLNALVGLGMLGMMARERRRRGAGRDVSVEDYDAA
jgi:hypothetical protein